MGALKLTWRFDATEKERREGVKLNGRVDFIRSISRMVVIKLNGNMDELKLNRTIAATELGR
ncbi:hypothetical protein DPMN_172195 [Dreissena polymorpha]|uniref:Uncharacterized protein n=1 Tax=Dreissena polymorpha TaxID=45954 RepID=A0A9D4E352_DREPO|nr:hypothetical protein DPMN_172195 [Dreissena polymorpha]